MLLSSLTQVNNAQLKCSYCFVTSYVNGNLTVKWTFIYTGDIPLNNISIFCKSEELKESGNSSELTNTSLSTSMTDCIVQSMSVGLLTGGTNYNISATTSK